MGTGAEGEIKNLKTAIVEQKQKTREVANTLAAAEKDFAAAIAGTCPHVQGRIIGLMS